MKKTLFVATAISLLLFASITLADIPRKISVQGILSDAGGNPIASGSYNLSFRFYDSYTGGNLIGSPVTVYDVVVTDGLFNVEINSALDFDIPYYINVSVQDSGVWNYLSPRINLTSAAYAFTAGRLLPTSYPISIDLTGKCAGVPCPEGRDAITILADTDNDRGTIVVNRNALQIWSTTLNDDADIWTSDTYAERIIDIDDNAYYCDPNGTSKLKQVNASTICIGTNCQSSWPSGVTSISAGNGLTASPLDPIITSGTLNVGAGTGITVSANSVSLDTTYTDNRYINTNGDTMTGVLNMGTNQLTLSGSGLQDRGSDNLRIWSGGDRVRIVHTDDTAENLDVSGNLNVGGNRIRFTGTDGSTYSWISRSTDDSQLLIGWDANRNTKVPNNLDVSGNFKVDGRVGIGRDPGLCVFGSNGPGCFWGNVVVEGEVVATSIAGSSYIWPIARDCSISRPDCSSANAGRIIVCYGSSVCDGDYGLEICDGWRSEWDCIEKLND